MLVSRWIWTAWWKCRSLSTRATRRRSRKWRKAFMKTDKTINPPSIDPTEDARRALVAQINREQAERDVLEIRYGQVWNTSELAEDFEVLEFAAPFVVVRRKTDT